MINFTKPVPTKANSAARILYTNLYNKIYPVAVAIRNNNHNFLEYYTLEGYYIAKDKPSEKDLVNVPERHKHADLIIAWTNGAKIQGKRGDEWIDIHNPLWADTLIYRIKPE